MSRARSTPGTSPIKRAAGLRSVASGRPASGETDGKPTRIQERNRARILEAGLSEFSRFGFGGATIEKIAAGAGMSKSNLLYYYPTKTAIYEAVLEHILDTWLAPLRMLDVTGDPATELADYIRQKLKISAEWPEASRLFASEILQGAPQVKPVLQGSLRQLVSEKAAVIRTWTETGRLKPHVDPVHLIFLIWAATQHYADFETQILALTGQTLKDETFRGQAEAALVATILGGVLA
ncbi:TetR family transcriptional regulator [Microvirga tunisiensis]|uniref:TetR family transcriptional regulator n=2 Tax=Pannonibacter tanglangensis TaxID=2750084 RepID=A0A7X5J7S3_9HYPH|nr:MULTISPECIES: TetR family transcriptional regulator C-terminal domain-containing protein [unclassified Pannonibacter]NBN62138.1 TetR family transcriptional regulator [Pannonibacter sp. XCT-34]NBN77807.1 TetR family transcriptional regulator [Pannonibacter sp. XCT-53]